MKKFFYTTLFLLYHRTMVAQINIGQQADNLWEQVRSNAGKIFAIIFLVSALINSGKLMGDSRDYVAFFRGVILWVAGIGGVIAVVSYLSSLRF